MVGRLAFCAIVLSGLWQLWMLAGVKETWPAVLVGGGAFAIAQYLTSTLLELSY